MPRLGNVSSYPENLYTRPKWKSAACKKKIRLSYAAAT